jgi:hypothetical protein
LEPLIRNKQIVKISLTDLAIKAIYCLDEMIRAQSIESPIIIRSRSQSKNLNITNKAEYNNNHIISIDPKDEVIFDKTNKFNLKGISKSSGVYC